jgi:pyruvate/2-oxoglutarate dehydrogenase complex dihydrolipoamide acyltransferase (E2) component
MRRVLAALGRHKVWSSVGGVIVLLAVVGGVNRLVSGPVANNGAQAASSSPAAASAPAPAASTPAAASSSPAPAVASSSPAPPPPSPSPVPSVLVSDNPGFDLAGSGDACRMHYFQDAQGRTVTLFNLAQDGELITHVSGPVGIGRHDQQETRGVSRIVYPFPLSQATDMGAVLYLTDGSSQSCTISAGSDVP